MKKNLFFAACALLTLNANAALTEGWRFIATQPQDGGMVATSTEYYDAAIRAYFEAGEDDVVVFNNAGITWTKDGQPHSSYYSSEYYNYGDYVVNSLIEWDRCTPGNYTIHYPAGCVTINGVGCAEQEFTFTVIERGSESLTYPSAYNDGVEIPFYEDYYQTTTANGLSTIFTLTFPGKSMHVGSKLPALAFDNYEYKGHSTVVADGENVTITFPNDGNLYFTTPTKGRLVINDETLYDEDNNSSFGLYSFEIPYVVNARQSPQDMLYYGTFYRRDMIDEYDMSHVPYKVVTPQTEILTATVGESAGARYVDFHSVDVNSIPNDNAVILRSTSNKIILIEDMDDSHWGINLPANDLKGVQETTAVSSLGAGAIYTLAAEDDEMAFYKFAGTEIPAHKAYLQLSTGAAPRRITLGTNTVTGMENTAATLQAEKIVRDGQLLIRKNGHCYNAQGVILQ